MGHPVLWYNNAMEVGFDLIYPIHLISACTQTRPCSKRMSKSMSVRFREGPCRNCPILNITKEPRTNESPVSFPDVSDIIKRYLPSISVSVRTRMRKLNWSVEIETWNVLSLSERIVGVEREPSTKVIPFLSVTENLATLSERKPQAHELSSWYLYDTQKEDW